MGGVRLIPDHLDEIDPERGLAENILRAALLPDGLLRSEPEFLLARESRIRDRDVHMSALRAVANGHTRQGEIAARMGTKPDDRTGGRASPSSPAARLGGLGLPANGPPGPPVA